MKLKAEEFDSRHSKMLHSLESHVSMLKDSVPFWKRFNTDSSSLEEWLRKLNMDLKSDNIRFGDAVITEQSLLFCQELQADIDSHNPHMKNMVVLGEELAKYVIPEDMEFIREFMERLKEGDSYVTKETDEKTELLEERLKSWKVSVLWLYFIILKQMNSRSDFNKKNIIIIFNWLIP